jgi:hypothetical protein
METKITSGSYVHVVATINLETGEGKILYVNPANSAVVSGAAPEKDVELAAADGEGKELYRAPVVVRRSSPEPDRPNDVGLIQADLPQTPDMKSVSPPVSGEGNRPLRRGRETVAPQPAAPSSDWISPEALRRIGGR